MKNYLRLVMFAFIAFTSSTNGQTPQQWTYMLQLKGHWEGNVVLELGGQAFNVNYSMNFKSDIGGLALTMDEGFSDPALGQLKGANLIGLNATDGMIHWFSVDNFGTAHEHIGTFTNSKHLYIEHSSIQGGLPFVERINGTLNSNNKKFTVSLIATLGPDTVQKLTGTLSKRGNHHRIADNSQITIEEEFNVFPNPTSGEFQITNAEMITEIRVTNEAGQEVQIVKPMNTEYILELKQQGLYYVTVTSGEKSQTKKIMVTN